MGDSVLKLLYSDSGEEEIFTCDMCGEIVDKDLEICPHCNKRTILPTLSEYGKRLPVGIEKDGILLKDFDIEPINWGKEKKVSSIMASQEWRSRRTVTNYISLILAHTVKSIGEVDISKFSTDKKISLFNEMYQGDVFYMYAYLRMITNGTELALKDLECTNNPQHKFGVVIDISSMKVVNIESVSELETTFKLKDGILLNKERRKELTISPIKWGAMSVMGNMSEAEMMDKRFIDSVQKIEGFKGRIELIPQHLDSISKTDANIIEHNLDMKHTGPLWVIDLQCPTCDTKMNWIIDWSYKNFFTDSYTLGRR